MTTELLEKNGWLVLRFWEHEEPGGAADHIRKALQERSV
jgi:hypothetical protein